MKERVFLTRTAEDTERLGERVGALLFPGAFLALSGELGAGKTAFIRGVGRALGTSEVVSPTFTIVQEHDTLLRLFHFDVYRLSGEEELNAIGFSDYLSAGGVILMEWAELVSEALPRERLDLTLSYDSEGRRITMRPLGAAYERLVNAI